MFDEATKTIDFQHISKDSFNDRVNQLLQSNKLINKINRSKDSLFLNKDTIDISIKNIFLYIQKKNILDSFETTPSLSMQINLIETPKRAKDASINSYEIDRSKAVREKIFEKAKFNRLKAIILKSITKDIEVIIRNELLCNKYTLANQSSN